LTVLGIDSTTILLNLPFAEYGYHSLTKTIEKGIKLHIGAVLGRFTIPLTAMVTPMNVSDHAEFDNVLGDMKPFVDLKKVILVFDRGYWEVERFINLTLNGIKFITRLKEGVRYRVLTEKKGGKKKKWEDMDIEFTSYPGEVFRLVVIRDGKDEFWYVTNNWDLTPLHVHMCYKQRWDMEVLNKILKSNLAIDHFMAKNLNAMLIQIFITLIFYLLIALFQIFRNSLLSMLEIKRLIEHCGHLPFKKVAGIYPMLAI
jgi:putative transposase